MISERVRGSALSPLCALRGPGKACGPAEKVLVRAWSTGVPWDARWSVVTLGRRPLAHGLYGNKLDELQSHRNADPFLDGGRPRASLLSVRGGAF